MNEQTLYNYYGYFFSKVYEFDNFKFSPANTDIKIAENFLKTFKGGEIRLFEYVSSSFNYYTYLNVEFGMKKVLFNWVFGKKYLERFNSTEDFEQLYYFNKVFQGKYNLSLQELSGSTGVRFSVVDLNLNEERIKGKIVANSQLKLRHCLLNTTLYNPISLTCISCNASEQCKILLRHKHPTIAKARKVN